MIYPQVRARLLPCPRCGGTATARRLFWQGIHICAESVCQSCWTELVADLPVGHSISYPCIVDLERGTVHGPGAGIDWWGGAFLESLLHPQLDDSPRVEIQRRRPASHVLLLNCLDFLYGHALLKLLNAEVHRPDQDRRELVVVVPECLAWMVPICAAEVWAVGGSLKGMREYSPALRRVLESQLSRFTSVALSSAFPHPAEFDISHFTGFQPHRQLEATDRISFIWREDRLWRQPAWCHSRLLRRFRPAALFLAWQNRAITRLFDALRGIYPLARFSVLGLGRSTCFPDWIDDQRVESFTRATEVAHCRAYSESRLVIGVHGSNLLLPSAHAWATLDLMPDERWNNMTEDILYQEPDPRLAAWRYRFVSTDVEPMEAAKVAHEQLSGLENHRLLYRTDASNEEG